MRTAVWEQSPAREAGGRRPTGTTDTSAGSPPEGRPSRRTPLRTRVNETTARSTATASEKGSPLPASARVRLTSTRTAASPSPLP